MIEVTLRQYLESELGGVPVVMEYPKNPPKQFVVLQLADGDTPSLPITATISSTIRDTFRMSRLRPLKASLMLVRLQARPSQLLLAATAGTSLAGSSELAATAHG